MADHVCSKRFECN